MDAPADAGACGGRWDGDPPPPYKGPGSHDEYIKLNDDTSAAPCTWVVHVLLSWQRIQRVEARYRRQLLLLLINSHEVFRTMPDTEDPSARINEALGEIRRRADQDPAFKYERFDAYPWPRDPVFQVSVARRLTASCPILTRHCETEWLH
jgi:hypothetical protein